MKHGDKNKQRLSALNQLAVVVRLHIVAPLLEAQYYGPSICVVAL